MFIIDAIANIIFQVPARLHIIFPTCHHQVKENLKLLLLCLLERKRIAYFTEDEEFFARLGLITLKMVLKTMSSRAFVLITLKMVLRTMSSRAFV